MFADISGFTNLTERLSKIGRIIILIIIGPEGAELIAFAINRYMELLVSAINKSGGDIFKFAGGIVLYDNLRCHDCCMAAIYKNWKSRIIWGT